jgi:NADPH:quinone reductase-like Zn-dependent oxidoreductase
MQLPPEPISKLIFFLIEYVYRMKAIQVQKPGHAAVVDVPVPSLPSSDHLLIKTVAVALNPTDWKHIANEPGPVIVGCDFSGIVSEVGSDLTSTFKKGDKVWGAVHGSNPLVPESGAFGEYLFAKGTFVNLVPEGMSFEETATLGVGVVTVGQGLYQAMGLPFPDAPLEKKKPILIYGGSSATGALGIQFAKL